MNLSLESVKAGDVLLISSHFSSNDRLMAVDRVTKTQVVIGGTKYRVSDGRQLGCVERAWNVPRASIPTPEQRESVRIRIAKERLIAALKSNEITALQIDSMLSVYEGLK